MTNTHKFMLKTGKYLPDEDIQFDEGCYYFKRFKDNKMIYKEYSDGYWEIIECNKNNSSCVYHENSNGDWNKKDSNGIIITSGSNK